MATQTAVSMILSVIVWTLLVCTVSYWQITYQIEIEETKYLKLKILHDYKHVVYSEMKRNVIEVTCLASHRYNHQSRQCLIFSWNGQYKCSELFIQKQKSIANLQARVLHVINQSKWTTPSHRFLSPYFTAPVDLSATWVNIALYRHLFKILALSILRLQMRIWIIVTLFFIN